MLIKAFIFDMDDVLCAYDVPRRIACLAAISGQTESRIRTSIWESDYFIRADRGEWTADECLAEFAKRLGYPLTRAEWIEARRAAMTPFDDMLGLVRQLKAQMPVALLTNNDRLMAETVDELFPALRPLFGTHLYVSAELDLAKPDPTIFRHIVTRLGISPEEALFVDDLLENVEGAKSAGLHAIQFEGFDAFRAALAVYKVPFDLGAE